MTVVDTTFEACERPRRTEERIVIVRGMVTNLRVELPAPHASSRKQCGRTR